MNLDCGAWINMLSHKVKKRLNATLAEQGITGVQSRVMHYILAHCEEGPVFQRDVEEAFELSRSTTTGIVQLLEKKGIIRRESVDSDARLKESCPDRKGRTDRGAGARTDPGNRGSDDPEYFARADAGFSGGCGKNVG